MRRLGRTLLQSKITFIIQRNYILHQCFSLHISFIKLRFSVKLEDEVKIRFLVAKIVLFFKLTFSQVISYFCGAQEVCFELKKNKKRKKVA